MAYDYNIDDLITTKHTLEADLEGVVGDIDAYGALTDREKLALFLHDQLCDTYSCPWGTECGKILSEDMWKSEEHSYYLTMADDLLSYFKNFHPNKDGILAMTSLFDLVRIIRR